MKSKSIPIDSINSAKSKLTDMLTKMTALNAAVPTTFDTAKSNYLAEIDKLQVPIEDEYQKTLNVGFRQVYLTVMIASLLAICILALYKSKKDEAINT